MCREWLICDRIKITLFSMKYGFAGFFLVQDSFMVAEMVWCVCVLVCVWFPFGGTLCCPDVYLCDTGHSNLYLGCSSFLCPVHGFGETWFISLGERGRLVRSTSMKRRREEKEEHGGIVFDRGLRS